MVILRERTADRIRKLGLNQLGAANRAGLGAPLVNDLLRGRRHRIRPDNLIRLAKGLDVSVAYLTGEVDDPAPSSPDDEQSAVRFFDRTTAYRKELERRLRQGRFPVPCPDHLFKAHVVSELDRDEAILADLHEPGARPSIPLLTFPDPREPAALAVVAPSGSTQAVPQQIGTEGAYALVIPDVGLSPRLEEGDTVYAVRMQPCLGDLVVAKSVHGGSPILLVRQIIGASAEGVQLRTLEPATEQWIPFSRLQALHTIRAIVPRA